MPDALTGPTTHTPSVGAPATPAGAGRTTGFNSVTGAADAVKTARAPGGELGKDAFLKLLVAQLKYQNPMSPTDSDKFLAQTAQFTMVEKLEEISKAQADLTVWQKVNAGQSLVGRSVTGTNDLGTEVTGVVTGLSLGADGPRLLLADGSTMAVGSATRVTAASPAAVVPTAPAPAAAVPTAAAPSAGAGTTGTTGTTAG